MSAVMTTNAFNNNVKYVEYKNILVFGLRIFNRHSEDRNGQNNEDPGQALFLTIQNDHANS